MGTGVFGDAGVPDRIADRLLQDGLVEVVTAVLARHPVDVNAGGREHPLPGPFTASVRVLASEGPGQFHPAGAVLQVARVLPLHRFEVLGQRILDGGRQHGERGPCHPCRHVR